MRNSLVIEFVVYESQSAPARPHYDKSQIRSEFSGAEGFGAVDGAKWKQNGNIGPKNGDNSHAECSASS